MPSWDDVVKAGLELPGVEVGGLEHVDPVELSELVEDAWRLTAPPKLVEGRV